jgi:hypothetical protein
MRRKSKINRILIFVNDQNNFHVEFMRDLQESKFDKVQRTKLIYQVQGFPSNATR